ncbi:hypothetical protein D3C76_1261990 [compost metagenome]
MQRLSGGGQIQGDFAPGVETCNQIGRNIKLFNQIDVHQPPAVTIYPLQCNIFWHFQRRTMCKGIRIQIVQSNLRQQ